MSLAFQFGDDKSLTKEDFEPGKIVSLWDMLRFYAAGFVSIFSNIANTYGYIQALESPFTQSGASSQALSQPILNNASGFREFEKSIENLVAHSRSLGLSTTTGAAEILLQYLSDKTKEKQYSDIREKTGNLIQTAILELRGRITMMLSQTGAHLYGKEGTFLGEDILTKYPELREDAAEAGNCFAVSRYTACVFHLMRIMERMVHRLGRKKVFVVKDLHKLTWGVILGRVKQKIDKLPDKSESDRKRRNRYYKNYLLLDAVCKGVRNPLSHTGIIGVKTTYTEEEARIEMDRVRSFVENFASLR